MGEQADWALSAAEERGIVGPAVECVAERLRQRRCTSAERRALLDALDAVPRVRRDGIDDHSHVPAQAVHAVLDRAERAERERDEYKDLHQRSDGAYWQTKAERDTLRADNDRLREIVVEVEDEFEGHPRLRWRDLGQRAHLALRHRAALSADAEQETCVCGHIRGLHSPIGGGCLPPEGCNCTAFYDRALSGDLESVGAVISEPSRAERDEQHNRGCWDAEGGRPRGTDAEPRPYGDDQEEDCRRPDDHDGPCSHVRSIEQDGEAALTRDFYRCPNTGEWVYKWCDERMALRSDHVADAEPSRAEGDEQLKSLNELSDEWGLCRPPCTKPAGHKGVCNADAMPEGPLSNAPAGMDAEGDRPREADPQGNSPVNGDASVDGGGDDGRSRAAQAIANAMPDRDKNDTPGVKLNAACRYVNAALASGGVVTREQLENADSIEAETAAERDRAQARVRELEAVLREARTLIGRHLADLDVDDTTWAEAEDRLRAALEGGSDG